MLNLEKLPKAQRDIVNIAEFIAMDNENEAERFFEAVGKEFVRLVEFPYLGRVVRLRRVAGKNIRRWGIEGFHAYSIFYRVVGKDMKIVRVLHGARNISRELRKRS